MTDRRIIGVKEKGKLLAVVAGATLGGVLGKVVAERLTREEKAKLISELEKKRDFDVPKDEVAEVILKKPSFFKAGSITIKTGSGEEIKIVIGGKKEYETLLDLMRSFKPEALKVE